VLQLFQIAAAPDSLLVHNWLGPSSQAAEKMASSPFLPELHVEVAIGKNAGNEPRLPVGMMRVAQ